MLAIAGVLVACGGKGSGGTNNNNVTVCTEDNECAPGEVCRGNQCVPESDAGVVDADVDEPDIVVSENTLDFESPLIGAEVTLPLTIHNVGDADLNITLLEIIETGGPGSPQEFHCSEEGPVDITIPPNGDHTVQVSLLTVDDELDIGELRIYSNDPDENPVSVALVSEHKGVADIETCATEEGATMPEAPWLSYPYDATDCVVDANDDTVVDFGLVQFQEPQRRVLAIYNVAQGNAPLTINSVLLTNMSLEAYRYSLGYWVQDENTGEATTVSLPYFLSAGDVPNGVDPTVLYVTVDFDASTEIFPTEQLEILSNDPAASQVYVDVRGVVTGCPPNQWDIDPLIPGCEYSCVFQSTTEDCDTLLVDDNCNGVSEEPGADNCITYYRDHDADGFGDTNDATCLCAAAGEYIATVGGDCDDNDEYVNPSVAERCLTLYDDNCDGSDNDLNAQGCTTYLRDEDGDNYGVTGDTQCLCYAAGFYTATLPGDCDDDPTGCGVACNPGMLENCATAEDDNCNGNPNEQNAPNCINYYRDSDGDGYGHQTLSQCWCAPAGLYNVTDSSDCNDDVFAINPGATEVCDSIDNNCVGGIDEGFNLQTDVLHCGACNSPCINNNGTTQCVNGVCDPTCNAGFGDCDGDPANGCEQNLSVVSICGTCGIHTDCPPDFFCNLGICTKEWNNGHSCSFDVECSSGLCRDGVCCNADCAGLCRSCAVSGNLGTCTNYTTGTDPEGECASEVATSCGQTGFCEAGACQLWASGTQCVPESCAGTTHQYADTCDGAGGCADNGSEDCSPYICGATTCRPDCTNNTHCVAGYFCASGVCTPQAGLGDPCTLPSQCSTGFCEDGRCCNVDCDGPCKACNVPGNLGTCMNHASGSDPESPGCGSCGVCDGSGDCAAVAAGQDPKGDCAQQSQLSCGTDGTCDGSYGCRLWLPGTVCIAQSCSNHVLQFQSTCNGLGTCVPGSTQDCYPYECNGIVCGTSPCGGDGDCVSGYYCSAGGVCLAKKNDGDDCNNGNECTNGNCIDGKCCNTTCGGECEACDVPGHFGVCWPHPLDTDPDSECSGLCRSCNGAGSCHNTSAGVVDPDGVCSETVSTTCGTRATCDGAGDCEYWGAGIQCNPQTCSNHTEYPADFCDGNGTCVNSGSTDCHPYECSGNSCLTSCTNDGHCVSGYYCVDNTCCLSVGTDSGTACGFGAIMDFDNNNSNPEGTTLVGNLVGVTERWYRFRAHEVNDDLNIWVWLSLNPGSEYRMDFQLSPSTFINCTNLDDPLCGHTTHYDWHHSGCSVNGCQDDDSQTVYIRVYRNSSVQPTCDNYNISIQVGGTTAPW